MLKLSGETSVGLEKIEAISYTPAIQATGDLEAGTKTITATSKPGTADYSSALTLPDPDDARLVIKRIAARLEVTRDSGTSSNLYCTVSVDSADGSTNKLFDGVDVQAGNLQVVDTHSGNLSTIFNLLKDGAAHTFYFFFWVDAGDSVISLVQLWEGVGSGGTSSPVAFRVDHTGWVCVGVALHVKGTGTQRIGLEPADDAFGAGVRIQELTNVRLNMKDATFLSSGYFNGLIGGTVATDLSGIYSIIIQLRGEQ